MGSVADPRSSQEIAPARDFLERSRKCISGRKFPLGFQRSPAAKKLDSSD
jgi:hypothetical protein